MINEHKTLKVGNSVRQLDGHLIGFSNGDGIWFYTPSELPDDIEETNVADGIEIKSHNFPTKEAAEAYGLGFEKGRKVPNSGWIEANNSHSDYHWQFGHREHDEWKSITVDEEPWGVWTVELYYPSEMDDVELHKMDTEEEAAKRVAEMMERYDE